MSPCARRRRRSWVIFPAVMSSGVVPRRGAMRVRRSRLVKPWGSSRRMSRACKSVDPGVAETEPGYAGAVAGDDRRGELGECLGAADPGRG